ncbi:hypothetical protein SAMN04489726_4701 [Allokutzneria albata]|uniref:Uncharacterized protein n=1 Tax=Allokutzneria albata TaxID=211114 RepID=A0A1G9YAC5_ALLAB|nr:hypothetical protein SAMN04489726_4701 [Allokutzneria albata]
MNPEAVFSLGLDIVLWLTVIAAAGPFVGMLVAAGLSWLCAEIRRLFDV